MLSGQPCAVAGHARQELHQLCGRLLVWVRREEREASIHHKAARHTVTPDAEMLFQATAHRGHGVDVGGVRNTVNVGAGVSAKGRLHRDIYFKLAGLLNQLVIRGFKVEGTQGEVTGVDALAQLFGGGQKRSTGRVANTVGRQLAAAPFGGFLPHGDNLLDRHFGISGAAVWIRVGRVLPRGAHAVGAIKEDFNAHYLEPTSRGSS